MIRIKLYFRIDCVSVMWYHKRERGEHMEKETIGSRLRKLRQSVKISQRKMGELLGVSQSAIDRYERDTSSPSAENFVAYADYFDVSLDYIFGRCDEPQGKLYEHRPRIEQGNPDLKLCVDMCFDPTSPMSERLKEVLTKMLEDTKR